MSTFWLTMLIWLGAMFLLVWLYLATKLCCWAYFSVKQHFQGRKKDGEESA
jgi:hypothetical protein